RGMGFMLVLTIDPMKGEPNGCGFVERTHGTTEGYRTCSRRSNSARSDATRGRLPHQRRPGEAEGGRASSEHRADAGSSRHSSLTFVAVEWDCSPRYGYGLACRVQASACCGATIRSSRVTKGRSQNMGGVADAIAAYAQPLIDQTDGSIEQVDKALAMTQFCFNLALIPDDQRGASIDNLQQSLGMDDAEFAEVRQSIIEPMLRRHEEMFPGMHQRSFDISAPSFAPPLAPERRTAARGEKYPGTDRYAPCPCGSGEKYKFCCGAKGR